MTKACPDLVQESQRAVAFSEVANVLDRPNAAAHGVDTLKRDDLRDGLGVLRDFLLEIFQIVVLENDAPRSRVAHALNHGSVVHSVGEDDTPWKFGPKSGERCIVCDVAGREH